MRAFVTGATGFIGSHLVKRLAKEGWEVAVLIRHDSNLWRIKDVVSKMKLIYGDFKEIEKVELEIQGFNPSVAFHLGWSGVKNRDFNSPEQIQNLMGTLTLLKVLKNSNCQVFVGLGSQAEYGVYNEPIDEEFCPKPVTLYGLTKLCTGMLAQRLCELYGMRFVWLRLFGVYGPADNPSSLISYVILSLLNREKPALTKGEQKWDYLYVEDVVEAIYRVAVSEKVQGVFNLGSGKVHQIKSIVEQIRDLIDPSMGLGLGEISYDFNQTMYLQAKVDKLKKEINWYPKISLEEGLKRTVDWYKEHKQIYQTFQGGAPLFQRSSK
ncbi:NAD-dependent epimerase/dehydratase family protein [Thermodesulfobacterium thermophilum]|uniref:NAD-dependent epimerase/dehydratase family protein n=1 Tax=Thermodesulfobacterium thermophilum TaxID=886 RepID=UPI0003B6E5D8|nr:NAD(P)-dependent oxidoreductase [Thermodesulfobacterium thermophilum]